jgi:hypothetical protein
MASVHSHVDVRVRPDVCARLKPRRAVPAGRRARNPILERNKKTASIVPAENKKEYVP